MKKIILVLSLSFSLSSFSANKGQEHNKQFIKEIHQLIADGEHYGQSPSGSLCWFNKSSSYVKDTLVLNFSGYVEYTNRSVKTSLNLAQREDILTPGVELISPDLTVTDNYFRYETYTMIDGSRQKHLVIYFYEHEIVVYTLEGDPYDLRSPRVMCHLTR
jgi:hypothetical protein